MDSYSSSEAFGMGISTTNAQGESATATFALGPDCAIFTEDGRRVEPGSGESGRLAVGGPIPLGYYKDPVKSAQTFPTYEGKRWSMPGDWASVDADGTVRILGRGSQCINTGGEKVFPEEVEEALKRHPAVRDAAVTGVPDARFGERIVALVEPHPARARRGRIARPCQSAARDLQGAAPRPGGRQRRARAQRQARLQGDQGPRARRVRGAGRVTHPQQGLSSPARSSIRPGSRPTNRRRSSTPNAPPGALADAGLSLERRRRLFLRGRRAGVRRHVDDRLYGAEGAPHRQHRDRRVVLHPPRQPRRAGDRRGQCSVALITLAGRPRSEPFGRFPGGAPEAPFEGWVGQHRRTTATACAPRGTCTSTARRPSSSPGSRSPPSHPRAI